MVPQSIIIIIYIILCGRPRIAFDAAVDAAVRMASKSSTKSKRRKLTLKQKVEVIEYVKSNRRVGAKKVADVFECGKTQIQSILLRQESIVSEYESNGSIDRKRHRTTDYTEVNDAMYKWYCLARQRCIPLSGPLLQEEALQIARSIYPNTCFKVSNGWLDSFKKRHNIKQENYYEWLSTAGCMEHR